MFTPYVLFIEHVIHVESESDALRSENALRSTERRVLLRDMVGPLVPNGVAVGKEAE